MARKGHVAQIKPSRPTTKISHPQAWRDRAIILGLVVVTPLVYSQVRNFEFVNYDDPDYVTDNVHVSAGITPASLTWAFTSSHGANWFPITWLSHMLDFQLFGLHSGMHHVTNVLLHSLSAALLFIVLRRITGSRWPSALVAFLFALHPLHVESVAWVSERKDVLSTFFFFVSLWCYSRYVDRPGFRRYFLVAVSFCLAILCKPMAVTLPFVLLLLDYWPLRRTVRLATLLREKIPLFALSAAVSVLTFIVQQQGGAVEPIGAIPLSTRIANALVSYVEYAIQVLWPTRMSVFYPYPPAIPAWQIIGAFVVILAVSILVLRAFRGKPYLAVGWLWYLGTLLPVIGLIQVGEQSRADRYTYIPLIGLFIMLAWGAEELARSWPKAKGALTGALVSACTACVVLTWFQIQPWRNSDALFRHAIGVTNGNYVAYTLLGLTLRGRGQIAEAASYYEKALQAHPHFIDAENNLAEARVLQGRASEAIPLLLDAVQEKPDFVEAHINLGAAFDRLGKTSESAGQYSEALRLQPDNAVADAGLGAVLAEEGHPEEALLHLQRAITIQPDYAEGHFTLGELLGNLGRADEAAAQFREVVRLKPDDAEAYYNLGTALGKQGHMDEAIEEFRAALRLRPNYADAFLNLGSALANQGHLDDAIVAFSEALRINPNQASARDSLDQALALKRGE